MWALSCQGVGFHLSLSPTLRSWTPPSRSASIYFAPLRLIPSPHRCELPRALLLRLKGFFISCLSHTSLLLLVSLDSQISFFYPSLSFSSPFLSFFQSVIMFSHLVLRRLSPRDHQTITKVYCPPSPKGMDSWTLEIGRHWQKEPAYLYDKCNTIAQMHISGFRIDRTHCWKGDF